MAEKMKNEPRGKKDILSDNLRNIEGELQRITKKATFAASNIDGLAPAEEDAEERENIQIIQLILELKDMMKQLAKRIVPEYFYERHWEKLGDIQRRQNEGSEIAKRELRRKMELANGNKDKEAAARIEYEEAIELIQTEADEAENKALNELYKIKTYFLSKNKSKIDPKLIKKILDTSNRLQDSFKKTGKSLGYLFGPEERHFRRHCDPDYIKRSLDPSHDLFKRRQLNMQLL